MIRSGLEKSDMNQSALASKLDVAPSYISKILNDEYIPGGPLVREIAAITKLNVTSLLKVRDHAAVQRKRQRDNLKLMRLKDELSEEDEWMRRILRQPKLKKLWEQMETIMQDRRGTHTLINVISALAQQIDSKR